MEHTFRDPYTQSSMALGSNPVNIPQDSLLCPKHVSTPE